MICTLECYNKLLDFYLKNKENIDDFDYVRVLFLIKNIDISIFKNEAIDHIDILKININEMDIFEKYTYNQTETLKLNLYSNGYHVRSLYLQYDEHYIGYCECKPEDNGYYEEFNCCGKHCDYFEPYFSNEYDKTGVEFKVEFRIENYEECMLFNFIRDINPSQLNEYLTNLKIERLKNEIKLHQDRINELNQELEEFNK